MERVILHADLNNFYASVECLYNPEIRNKPVAVCGDPEARHGIVLAKNYPAKATGIKTGEAIWQARQKCPGLIVITPNFPLYLRFSRLARGSMRIIPIRSNLLAWMKPGWMWPTVVYAETVFKSPMKSGRGLRRKWALLHRWGSVIIKYLPNWAVI